MDRELTATLAQFKEQIDNLDEKMRAIDRTAQSGGNLAGLVNILYSLTNQLLVREMFLLEILREKGLLDELNLSEIEKRVRAEHADNPGYSVSAKRADLNVKMILGEIAGSYRQPEDYDPNWNR